MENKSSRHVLLATASIENFDSDAVNALVSFVSPCHDIVQILKEAEFQLVFIDPQYFTVNPLLLKQTSDLNQTIPFLALLEPSQITDAEIWINLGFDDFVAKPIDSAVVNELLEFWSPQQEVSDLMAGFTELLQKLNHDLCLAKTLYNKLFNELPEQIIAIEKALLSGNRQQAVNIVHMMHGSARICCLDTLKECAASLESALQSNNLLFAEGFFQMLQQHVDDLVKQQNQLVNFSG